MQPTPDQALIRFDGVHFSYLDEEDGGEDAVFRGLSIGVPSGVVSLVGQNGVGKSTFLLLAGARVFPSKGSVQVDGVDTREFARAAVDPDAEQRRNRLVSFIYQNMEFETQEPIGDLMRYVYAEGHYQDKQPDFVHRIQTELELTDLLGKRTQELSKGQLQRTIIGFSLLYGSRIVLMDEPVFALEEPRKERVFGFLMEIARELGLSLYYSAHNIDLTRSFSDTIMLFYKDGSIRVGPTAELAQRGTIEEAFQVPWDMLHRKEYLFREMLTAIGRTAVDGSDGGNQS
ncbi:MAG: ABC transporter ATP-binding protein [Spirochaetaceae bacterium]|nr:MAG: ABC transporter ATP-binding protein [Spirochaetaceae bacterium]